MSDNTRLAGIKGNKCFLRGVQGVCRKITATNTTGQSAIYSVNDTKNNTLYVLKEYVRGLFGNLPQNPEPDFNFHVTLNNAEGFTTALSAIIVCYDVDINAPNSPTALTINWDNPTFDTTDGYTVLHLYIWHDGINWCGHVDGY